MSDASQPIVAEHTRAVAAPLRQTLTSRELEPLLSPYLVDGYQAEAFAIDSLAVEGKKAVARCHMTRAHVSETDTAFHLSFITGSAMMYQLGIVHGCVLLGRREKSFEVWTTDCTLTLRKPMRATQDISIALELVRRSVTAPRPGVVRPQRSFLSWQVDFGGGSWNGQFGLCFPE